MFYSKLLLLATIIFCISCHNKIDDKLEQEIIATLEENNYQLNEEAKILYNNISQKLNRAETEARAFFYITKMDNADSLFKETDSTLNQLAIEIIDYDNINSLFKNYVSSICNLDTPFIKDLKEGYLTLTNTSSNHSENFIELRRMEFCESNRLNIALCKNKVILLRNCFYKWCTKMLYSCDYYYSFQAIVSQNSRIFSKNDEIEISAGIGGFNKIMNPIIIVDKDTVKTNEDGVAVFKQNVGNKKGRFSKKIVISFLRPNGIKEATEKQIFYTVD